jgi:hypothetical protein
VLRGIEKRAGRSDLRTSADLDAWLDGIYEKMKAATTK